MNNPTIDRLIQEIESVLAKDGVQLTRRGRHELRQSLNDEIGEALGEIHEDSTSLVAAAKALINYGNAETGEGPFSKYGVQRVAQTIRRLREERMKTSLCQVWPFCVSVAKEDGIVVVWNSADPNRNAVYFSNEEWDAFIEKIERGQANI
jgi:hypothetical protein